MIDLRAIDASTLDSSLKGYPHRAPPCAVRDIGLQGWNVMRGDLPFPVAVLKELALAHNLQWMADFTRATGVLLAPHGKTTMAPQLFARQIEAGAWGITFATVQQASLGVRAGVRRIILANQLVGREDIVHAMHLHATIPDLELHVLVDSIAQLRLIEARATEHAGARPLNALLEMGIAGGRTGCRGVDEAMAVARAVAASRIVRLSGVECFEGLNVSGDSEADQLVVDRWMRAMQQVVRQCDAEGLFGTEEVTLSAGGSAVFDLVARGLPLPLSRPVRTILRSGCYVTHDSGFYERFLRQVLARSGAATHQRGGLTPALEIWTEVQSQPEPGLAILAFGKRDASFDLDLPMPFARVRDGVRTPLDGDWRIGKLNDQHAYMQMPVDADARVGDLVGCGISHPCTTFDKWRWLPLVDDDYGVIGAVRTFF
ncbi:MAG: amino acid deaminase [Burkholderiales bacterium]